VGVVELELKEDPDIIINPSEILVFLA